MFLWLKRLFKRRERCTTCGKPFLRAKWGGRIHLTPKGGFYIHPIDYLLPVEQIERMDRLAAKWKRDRK